MKILVAVDGSPYTLKALDYLSTNRTMFVDGHDLVVVHVSPGIPGHVARHVSKEVVESYYAEECTKVTDPLKVLLAERSIANYTVQQRHGHAPEEAEADFRMGRVEGPEAQGSGAVIGVQDEITPGRQGREARAVQLDG